MAVARQLITILARINPHLWEIPHPHEPGILRASVGSRFDQVMLNPQPLPPKAAFLAASAAAANDMAKAVIAAEAGGTSSREVLSRAIDEWCGTSHPWPWPWPWPGPWPPVGPDPEPHPEWDFAASRLVGALTLAGVAARMREGDGRAALEEAADRLLDAALAE
jgi:hypothetical protein